MDTVRSEENSEEAMRWLWQDNIISTKHTFWKGVICQWFRCRSLCGNWSWPDFSTKPLHGCWCLRESGGNLDGYQESFWNYFELASLNSVLTVISVSPRNFLLAVLYIPYHLPLDTIYRYHWLCYAEFLILLLFGLFFIAKFLMHF